MTGIVMSDIHGSTNVFEDALDKALKQVGHVDAFFCLGDGLRAFHRVEGKLRERHPHALMYEVKGNNDFGVDAPYSMVVNFGGAKIFLTHGYDEHVKETTVGLDAKAAGAGCSMALYGHTHCFFREDRRTIMMNPGAAENGMMALLVVENGQLVTWEKLPRQER